MTDPRPVQRAGQPSQDEPEMKSLLQAWQMYNSKKEDDEPDEKPAPEDLPPAKEKLIPPPKQAGPEDPEIMEALLDAFEDNVNLGEKRGLRRWLERKNYPKIAEWVEKMKQDAYYEAMAGFFKNLAGLRKRSPKLLSGIEEQTEVPADKKLEMPGDNPQAQDPSAEPTPEEPPADEPISDEPEAKPQLFDIHSAVMDMYLEGIDITRRSQLIDALDKGGHEAEVETVSSLSLTEFYTFLSDFFKKLAGSLGSEGPDTATDLPADDEIPADKALEVPPTEEPEPQQESDKFMLEREMKLDLEAQAIAAPEDLANELLDVISQNTGDKEAAKKDVNVLLAQIARGNKVTRDALSSVAYKSETPDELVSALVDILVKHDVPVDAHASDDEGQSEAHGLDIPLPYSRRSLRKSIRREKMFTEAPEELLPGEVREAKRMTLACVDGGIPLSEAAQRVAAKMGKEKKMPAELIKGLEKYLGSLSKAKNEDDEPVDAPKDEPKKKADPEMKKGADKDEDEDEAKKDKEAPKDELPVITGDQVAPVTQPAAPEAPVAATLAPIAEPTAVMAPAQPPAEAPEEPEEEPKDGDEDEAKKGEEEDEEKGKEDDEEKGKEDDEDEAKGKKDEQDDEEEGEKKDDDEEEGKKDEANDALGELLRLALAPSRRQWGSGTVTERKMPKAIAILKEDTTGAGVSGARDTGVLDVFSFGGYLERALPYLISASMSRFEEGDKAKFVNLYRKFTETNDITEMTKLAGALADVVEWGDATQEGAELVKNLRFMSDFMNVLRGSVDYSKRAFPAI